MNWDSKELDVILDLGIKTMRNRVATDEQVQEAATRVFETLKREDPTLPSCEPISVEIA